MQMKTNVCLRIALDPHVGRTNSFDKKRQSNRIKLGNSRAFICDSLSCRRETKSSLAEWNRSEICVLPARLRVGLIAFISVERRARKHQIVTHTQTSPGANATLESALFLCGSTEQCHDEVHLKITTHCALRLLLVCRQSDSRVATPPREAFE